MLSGEVYFHVDRRRQVEPNQTFGWNASPYTFEQENREVLEKFFPEKLSAFGQQHVTQAIPSDTLGGRQALEYIWEHQRRLIAPDAPSRLASVFACPDLEGARLFCRDRFRRDRDDEEKWPTPEVPIWRIRADSGFRADMNWLPWNGGLTDVSSPFTLAQLVSAARKYWRGEMRGSNPFWEVLLNGATWVEGLEEVYDASQDAEKD